MDDSNDVLREREQERRARMQLLDDIREPSPQPIFGEPVKVDLEDETSRRIKNTLGDFTQVLVNDPKNLIGITRSTPVNPNVAAGYSTGPHGTHRNQVVVKKPPYGHMSKPSNYVNPKVPDKRYKIPVKPPPVVLPYATTQAPIHIIKEPRKSIPEAVINSAIWNCPPANNPFYVPSSSIPKDALAKTEIPAKRNIGRPSNLKIPPERTSCDIPIAVETILKQMTDVVAPLTGIQTPRKEETGFPFSAKQETPSLNVDKDVAVPPYTELPFRKQSVRKSPWKQPDTIPVVTIKDPEKPVSLQDDLAVSDSDEEVVAEVKINPEQCLKSPVRDSNLCANSIVPTTTSNNTMDDNSVDSSNSSSSEDSDSDDSSSESNDSDSSSAPSDEEISSKKWGLSNFVDESQRIHSPAFFPADASKESIRLNAERVKVDSSNANPVTAANLVQDSLHQPGNDAFLVPDVPSTAKSEILSPIPSPVHKQVGPRTPPSPSCSVKQDSVEINKNDSEILISQSENKSHDDKPPVKSSQLSDNCDISANKENVQSDKCKKQLRSSKSKETNSDVECSTADSVEESSNIKESPKIISEKDKLVTEVKSSTSNVAGSEASENATENYPIKTRQRVSARRKSTLDNSSESNPKPEEENSAIAKLKHPRACRKSTEKQNKKPTSMKLKTTEEPKKHAKQEIKNITNISEKVKTQKAATKPASTSKTPPVKAPTRTKAKSSRASPKKPVEIKKPEIKKKKFAIKNFVQSPENENIKPSNTLPPFTPSPERSPIPENQKKSETSTEPSTGPAVSSKSHGKSNTNNPAKVKKLRRSVRCSERASNIAQADSATTKPITENKDKKKNSKTIEITKHSSENPSISIEPTVELLSPLPQDPLTPSQGSSSAIPLKIMVCIPLNMLSRLPGGKKQESTSQVVFKSTASNEAKIQKKDSSEKSIKNPSLKSTQTKDKSKTNISIKSDQNNTKNLKETNKDIKPTNKHSAKTKNGSIVNKNTKDKSKADTADIENKLPKKRKNESEEKKNVKKPKLFSQPNEDRKPKELLSIIKTDPAAIHNNDVNKSKALERCDSTGSLSSLCSQQSQRSSKSSKDRMKDSSSGTPEAKRLKTSTTTLLSAKDIKQEKTDRPKVHSTIDKNTPNDKKNKSKDKLGLVDVVEQIWDGSLSSSQYCLYEDKEDSKAKILGSNPNATESTKMELEWDNFDPLLHKEMKDESTNKHNPQAPVMPMDYYFTEGRKQKQLAEKEKDPFQQAVKYFEAAVLFILTSQQREEYSKDPVSVYQFYKETLKFSDVILSKVKKLQTCPGSTEFKLLILCLKCQSLLSVKLYNLKIKEIKEQLDGVAEFLQRQCSAGNQLKLQPQSRFPSIFSFPSPHYTIPSPASNSQSGKDDRTVSVPQSTLDRICRQHTHLISLHKGHDYWEQADMYMTRSNLREFFKEVADQLEPLTLHSSITELVKYIQKGISLVKKSLR